VPNIEKLGTAKQAQIAREGDLLTRWEIQNKQNMVHCLANWHFF
jgi:hypothetical protein